MCSASGPWGRRRRSIPKAWDAGFAKARCCGRTCTITRTATPQVDRTRVGLYFGKGELKKEVAAALAGNVTFSIPPNEPTSNCARSTWSTRTSTSCRSFPHMHLRGKDMKMTATFPDGRQETLLNVPAYDFNWQLFYYPKTRIPLPRGTRVDLVAHYDNSRGQQAQSRSDEGRHVRRGVVDLRDDVRDVRVHRGRRRQSEAVDRARRVWKRSWRRCRPTPRS